MKHNPSKNKILLVKIIMLGDMAVGKTALIQRFVKQTFSRSYKSTMGLDISLKEVKVYDSLIRLQLWDLAGQVTFKSIRPKFYNGTRGAILVYDATRPATFHDLQYWLQELKAHVPVRIPFIVIGNKIDLQDLVLVTEEDEKFWASESKTLGYYRTSAKTGENVEAAFEALAVEIFNEIEKFGN
ncbi:MAG: Rab family GTPase [Promethearchaeota archaeon]